MKTTDAFTRGQDLISSILCKLPNIQKWHRGFMMHILLHTLSMQGRFNFMQMGREGEFNEQTYRNNFDKDFDYLAFNTSLVKQVCSPDIVIAFDPSHISKSGNKTAEIGMFYSGCAGRAKKGLEIGGLAAIDMQQHTAYHLEAVQTPSKRNDTTKTLVDHYAQVIVNRASALIELSEVLVVDGYFAKNKFVNQVCEQTNLTIVCRLRDDANLKYLYTDKHKGIGRPKSYHGKVNVSKVNKRRFKRELSDHGMTIYSALVYSVSLKRKIKVAYTEFIDKNGHVKATKLFFSTDLEMSGIDIVKYYRARFQIEYLYRDAKQHTGLEQGQSRSKAKMHNHFNISLTAISIGKVLLRYQVPKEERISLSISNVCTELRNRKMIFRVLSRYGFEHTLIKVNSCFFQLLDYGKIAA